MKKGRPRITDKSPNELPGVRKRSFILPFAGGEIWFEHLDGIYQYTPLAVQKLRADTAAFRRRLLRDTSRSSLTKRSSRKN